MSAFLSIRATSSDAGGDLLSPGERGSNGSGQSLTSDRVYSVLFLVPKKNGEMRPVINLKALNQLVDTPHFKMEGLPTLRDLLWQGDWLVKVDLKDVYLTVPIHPEHQCYLQFRVEGVNYQFTCLPPLG